MTEVVLIPGINNVASVWHDVVSHFPSTIAAHPVDVPPLEEMAEIAESILANAPARFVVVGHSFGGYVALAILARAPERILGLALVNSSVSSDSPQVAEGRREKAIEALAGGYEELASAASQRAYHPSNSDNPELLRRRVADIANYGAQRYAAHQRASATRPDQTELVKSSGIPMIVVAGDHDVVIPTEKQREMAKLSGARFDLVETAGHMMPAEQPGRLAAVLVDWIESL